MKLAKLLKFLSISKMKQHTYSNIDQQEISNSKEQLTKKCVKVKNKVNNDLP